MSIYPKDPSCIGVEASSSTFRIASLCKTRKGWKILQLKEISREANGNPLYGFAKDGVILTSIPSRDVLVRNVDVTAKKEKDALSAIEFQIEPHLPFPIDSAIVAAQVLEKKEEKVKAVAFIVKKDHLQKHLRSLAFDPEKVTCVPYAIAAFSQFISKTSIPSLWVHIGEEDVTVALVQEGKVLTARAFDKSLDIAKEVQKTILRIATTHKAKTFDTIFLIGPEGLSLGHLLQQETGKTVLFPASAELPFSQEDLMRYGLAIGIALASFGPNFRQKEFSYPHPFKRYKKSLFASLALSVILFLTMFIAHKITLNRQKELVREAYFHLLQLENKKEEKLPLEVPEAYLNALIKLEKEITERPDTYPLYPQIPHVKEFLTWISSLPEIMGTQRAEMDIYSLHYCMVNRPEFSRKKEHYKIKIELEFTAENPGVARAFHDALLSSHGFVDTKEEFKWNVSKGKYRAEFFLKDKTRYY